MKKTEGIKEIKEKLKLTIAKNIIKTTNKGRKEFVTIDECLDAIFLCFN